MKHLSFILSSFLLFIGLNAIAQNSGNGKITTKERSISAFNALKVSGNFDVELTPSLTGKLLIRTNENLIDEIITKVKNGALIIRHKKNSYLKSSNRKKTIIQVPLVALTQATLSGSGKIHSTAHIKTPLFNAKLSGSGKIVLSVEAAETNAQLSGSGRIKLKGTAENTNAQLSGSGSIRLEGIKAKNTTVSLSGSGSIYVRCTENLDAKVAGSGNVKYFGEPNGKLLTKVAGSGSIRLAIE